MLQQAVGPVGEGVEPVGVEGIAGEFGRKGFQKGVHRSGLEIAHAPLPESGVLAAGQIFLSGVGEDEAGGIHSPAAVAGAGQPEPDAFPGQSGAQSGGSLLSGVGEGRIGPALGQALEIKFSLPVADQIQCDRM